MVDRYRSMIEQAEGKIHRLEDWGRKQLAYPINKIHKAHYVLMNIEVPLETLQKIESAFRFSDAILRWLTIAEKGAVTEMSPMAKEKAREEEREKQQAERAAASRAANKTETESESDDDSDDTDDSSESEED